MKLTKKMMRYCYPMMALTLMLGASAFAQGGNGAGNGGLGVVCRNAQGQITSAQLLDLVEGAQMDGLTIPEQSLDRNQQIENASRKLSNWVHFGEVNLKYTWVTGFGIPDPKDFTPRVAIKDPSCRFEVIGVYFDSDNVLRIDQEIFNHLSPTHQAAFMTHEILYRYARRYAHVQNSNAVRPLVAALFSTARVPDSLKMETRAGAPYKVCFAQQEAGDLETKNHWVRVMDAGTDVVHTTSEFKVIFNNQIQYTAGPSLERTGYRVYLAQSNQLLSEGILYSGMVGYDRAMTNETVVELINPLDGKKVELQCEVETSYSRDYYGN